MSGNNLEDTVEGIYGSFISLAETIILCLLTAGYCAIQARNLLLPGIFSDEAFDGRLTQQVIRAGLDHTGNWPLNLNYHAALQSYLFLPFFLTIKRPEEALRIGGVVFGLIVIAMTYLCTRAFFNRTAALFTLILLIANPCFIYMSRISAPHVGIMAAFYLGALRCLREWSKTKRDSFLFGSAFLVGAGISLRLWFAWFILGLLLASPLVYPELIRLLRRPPKLGRIAGVLFFASFGLGLFVLKEIKDWNSDFELFRYAAAHFPSTGYADNLAVMKNMADNLHQFTASLAGYMLDCFPPYPKALDAHSLRAGMEFGYGALLLLSMAIILFLAKGTLLRKALVFMILMIGMFLCSLLTINAYRQDHLYMLFPLPQIIMGLAAYLLLVQARDGKTFRKTAVLMLALYLAAPVIHLSELSQIERSVRLTGGTGYYSDASIPLSAWLDKEGHLKPYICDWGFHDTLNLLSNGKINPQNCWDYVSADRSREFLSHCFSEANPYIFLGDPGSSRSFSFVSETVKTAGKHLNRERIFLTRNGEAAYAVYTLK